MDRRAFLSIVAGSPLIFGLRELVPSGIEGLLAQDPPVEPPEYFRAALARMKALDLPGVVLHIPDTAKQREVLAAALFKRLTGDSAQVREILTGCVLICAPPGIVKARDGANRLLLDSDGKLIEADEIGLNAIENPARFVDSFNRMLDGEKGERLEARARKAATPEARQAVKDLESDELQIREKATATLLKDAARLQPFLVHSRRSMESTEAGLRLKAVLERLYTGSQEKEPGPKLPYGTKIKEVVEIERGGKDPCPGCGMAVMTSKGTKFLKFLAHPDD